MPKYEEECDNLLHDLQHSEKKNEIIKFWENLGVDIIAFIKFQFLVENIILPKTIFDQNPNNVIKIRLKGFDYMVPLKDICNMGDGNRESWLAEELTMRDNELFVDVGANLGLFTIPIGKENKVIAFEPDERNFELLNQNIKLNKIQNNVRAINAAITNKVGEMDLYTGKQGVFSTIVQPENFGLGWKSEKTVKVKCITLDKIIEMYDIEKIDWLKVDVEGAEFLVLDGTKENLAKRKIKNILIEMHAIMFDNKSAQDIYEILKPNYALKILWTDPNNPKYHYLKATLN